MLSDNSSSVFESLTSCTVFSSALASLWPKPNNNVAPITIDAVPTVNFLIAYLLDLFAIGFFLVGKLFFY